MKKMEDYVKKCIQDHRNPLVKVNLPAQKLFFAAKTDDEKATIELYQEHMKIALGHQRVEKRCGRARGLWHPDSGKTKLDKVVKNIVKFFGVQDKTGIFLHPEEMLFLLETNRLEVTFSDTPLSIEKAYRLVLKHISLEHYRVYKKLALMGYKLVREEEYVDKKKRALVGTEESSRKKFKIGTEAGSEFVENLLRTIRDKMPRECQYESTCPAKPDYCIYLPKSVAPDFHLFICRNNEVPFKDFCSCKLAHIYAICSDDVTFYAVGNVHVPYI
ncbi:uncharacterized protein LOC126747050 [Anthonomus grandis grandis]|uniref:uncharacterized protein LOC126747050 n=1 Tax=Anthonomus grandis grandis TaxID=2921223 RepID=UPI0021651067|nr:uncharacterized protein LOC126747050 [Anthonomus grandis grandis]XP_050311491.1 uncharacterized protein LOC126747050 [Anthonomus grandis grandis]